MKYPKQLTYKEKTVILTHCSGGSSLKLGVPIVLGLWRGQQNMAEAHKVEQTTCILSQEAEREDRPGSHNPIQGHALNDL
jgi:hypothetical protein